MWRLAQSALAASCRSVAVDLSVFWRCSRGETQINLAFLRVVGFVMSSRRFSAWAPSRPSIGTPTPADWVAAVTFGLTVQTIIGGLVKPATGI